MTPEEIQASSMKPRMVYKSGLEDIVERMAAVAEKKKLLAETENP